mmetsp:Transcript_93844/g.148245  ORF Transcript_93844/g.148245 Transcript_93844/m.148245 type:complete len:203 (+) Transcript_93844:366-974(+)
MVVGIMRFPDTLVDHFRSRSHHVIFPPYDMHLGELVGFVVDRGFEARHCSRILARSWTAIPAMRMDCRRKRFELQRFCGRDSIISRRSSHPCNCIFRSCGYYCSACCGCNPITESNHLLCSILGSHGHTLRVGRSKTAPRPEPLQLFVLASSCLGWRAWCFPCLGVPVLGIDGCCSSTKVYKSSYFHNQKRRRQSGKRCGGL